MCNSSGTIVARYSYDPYGRTTLVSGANLATKQYAGMYMHQTSGLYLTMYRAYDPNAGRWLSRDPIGEGADKTLYSYGLNDPSEWIDPLGLDAHITYANGSTSTATNAQEFLDQINAASPGTITDIRIEGHGTNDNSQYFSRNTASGYIYVDPSTGKVYIVTIDKNGSQSEGPPIIPLIAPKLDPKATIELNGCDTDKLAKAVSKALPSHSVSGNKGNSYPAPNDTSSTNILQGYLDRILSIF